MFDLRSDPYERADITSNTYYDWFMGNAAPFMASQGVVGPFLATFKEFPPSQRPSSFSIDQLVEKMQRSFETQ
jgi:arylsulfatase